MRQPYRSLVSLYAVLGVDPSASDDALHHAYRVRARALHPDRHAGASIEARRAADEQMRELNAAWRVLSDPERRRDYDRTLAPLSSPRPPVDATRVAERDDVAYESPGVLRLARVIPLAVLLTLLAIIFVFTAIALQSPDDDPTGPLATGAKADAEVGDCVRLRGGHVDDTVACGAENDGEVVRVIDHDESCPDDERRVDDVDGSHAVCLTVF